MTKDRKAERQKYIMKDIHAERHNERHKQTDTDRNKDRKEQIHKYGTIQIKKENMKERQKHKYINK